MNKLPTAAELADKLPAGFCVLTGTPKCGKSFLSLQLTLALATAGRDCPCDMSPEELFRGVDDDS